MTSASDDYSSWWVGSWHCVQQFARDLTQVLYAFVHRARARASMPLGCEPNICSTAHPLTAAAGA